MKNYLQYLPLLFFICFLNITAQVEVTSYGDIPIDRISANGWAHFEWDGSGNWTTIDVTEHGIIPNTSTDIAPLVTAIIDGGSGKRILKFPAGTYQVKSGMNISKSDIQIVGEGSATRFMLAGGANPGRIYGNGGRSGNYKLSADVARGDNTATLTSASAFSIGDYFIIYQAGSVTREGASGNETQIFKVIAKSGNKLTLDMKFGIPFYKDHAYIEKISYKKNLRFHNFYMEMVTEPTDGKSTNLSLNTVQNVEVSNIESNKALTGHITIFRGRECIVHDNNVYGNYGGGGGFQYGYTFNFSTNCQMIHNRTADLRHHYVTQYGTDHCVIAYNRAEPTYNHYADYGQHNSKGCHNNLWEGNYGSEIYDDANPLKSWGTRYTMWFRNHATSKVGSENAYVEYMNIIGNELTGGSDAIKKGDPGKYTFAGANIVNIDKEGGEGTMIWGDMDPDDQIPASLFLTEKPDYVSRWPLYGPPASVHPRSELVINLIHPDTNFIRLEPQYNLEIESKVSDENLLDSLSLYIDGIFISSIKSSPFVWDETQSHKINNLAIGLHAFKIVASDTTDAVSTLWLSVDIREGSAPFTGEPIEIPGIIEAENYNQGGQDLAYYDYDSGNFFDHYRSDDVDIDAITGGYAVSSITDGEWLCYTIESAKAAYYNIGFSYAMRRTGGKIGLQIASADTPLFTQVDVPLTRGWNDFQVLEKDSVWLPEGKFILRINCEKGGYILDKIHITEQSATSLRTPATPEFAIHPNPSNGIFTIQCNSAQQASYRIFRLNGICFDSGTFLNSKVMDLSDHNPGAYIIHITTQQSRTNRYILLK